MPRSPSRPPLRAPSRRLRQLVRRPPLFWLLALLVTLVTALTVARLVERAEAEAARYGSLRPTLVATRDLAAGAVLAAGDAEVALVPDAFVPDGALDAPDVGAVVAAPVAAGEAVLRRRLAPAGRSPLAALLPPGTLGVAVPTGAGALRLSVGDLVDVLATVGDGTDGPPTGTVARAAAVVDVTEEAVTLAVEGRAAPRVAYALTAGAVTLALTVPDEAAR